MALGEMNSGNDIITDAELTQEGVPADAKTVGDKFKSIKTDWNSVTDKPSTFPPSAHDHSKLAFEHGNEVNFVGTPESNTVYWGYRDNTIDEYRFNDGRGSGAFANVRANKFIGSLEGNANTASKATGVTDYNSSSRTIQIGYAGDGLTTSNLMHIAGYTDDGKKIKDVSKAVLQSWLGIGGGSLAAYPVGAIYMSTSSTSPASLFGGSQTQIQNQFLLAAGSSYSAGSTGGSTTHSHSYGIRYNAFYATFVGDDTTAIRTLTYNGTSETGYKDSIWVQDVSTKRNSGLSSGSTSTSSASYLNRATTSGNSNMPPYLAVYVWKRTA